MASYPPSFNSLTTNLTHAKPQVRIEAIQQLAQYYGIQALSELERASRDKKISVRLKAVEALGRLADSLAIPPLLPFLHDPERLIRTSVVKALVRLRDPHLVDHLLPVLNGPGEDAWRVQRRVAEDAQFFQWSVAEALGDSQDPRPS